MTWRVANSLLVLRDEVNRVAPNRSKISDGTIGDTAHQARTSDHNPFIKDSRGIGVVRAMDVTHDASGGLDAGRLAEHCRILGARGDSRVRYVIWNHRIASAKSEWRWRTYTGSNPHTKHVHISVVEHPGGYDSKAPWGFSGKGPAPAPKWMPKDDLPLKRRHKDGKKKLVSKLQSRLEVEVDGFFGKVTEGAVKKWQSVHDEKGVDVPKGMGLEVDGIVGPKTWGALFPD